ncbi:hypothetical protein DSO57_1017213 [Entomophthora muscae]|uniref:Uncharacterized protein n=1 Tax=Entomophthora muscae TaxID=34485 RepID=A0ACC2U2N8_9FUNG|nr:hypothetical protein DSO57_1017213 [Entomophthora muscae]
MTPPPTLRPDRRQEITIAAEATFTQLFGGPYIALAGLVPNSGPGSLSAPILIWALPSGPAVPLPASDSVPATTWYPDINTVVGREWLRAGGVSGSQPRAADWLASGNWWAEDWVGRAHQRIELT